MKLIAAFVFLFGLSSVNVYAGAWSQSAVPSRIDIERAGGVMVYGEFGNAGNCSVSNRFYLKTDHPQYAQAYSAILAAFSSGKKVQVYVNTCGALTWYASTSTTFNIVTAAGVVHVMN